jgi:hypothetical protein
MSEKKIPSLKEILAKNQDKPDPWTIVNDNPLQFVPELIEHFSYLADTPGYKNVLDEIMSKAKLVSKTHDRLCWRIMFDNKGSQLEVVTGPPLDNKEASDFPDYYRSLVAAHSWLRIGDYELHSYGQDFDEDEEWGNVPKEFRQEMENLFSPIRCGSNLIFYHPYEKNDQGFPMICYTSSQSIESIYGINAGAYMLNYLASLLDILTPELIDEYDSERFKKYRM